MKTRCLIALAGLAISLGLPSFAQQKDIGADPHTTQKIRAIAKAYTRAINHNDAAAIAALHTEDGVLVSDREPVHGRQAIEKWYADLFPTWQPQNHVGTLDPDSPHLLGTAGNELWETGSWSETGQGSSGAPIHLKGYWSAIKVRQGEDWKILLLTANATVESAATLSPDIQ